MQWVTPRALGLTHGALQDCPASPNCVCSTATRVEQQIAPLTFSGDPVAALDRLAALLGTFPRTHVVTRTDNYLHATCTSLLFRFVDDLEALVDPAASVIHLRSASRVGYSDLGANRQRIERLRQAWNTDPTSTHSTRSSA